jgi:hypothetical protein
MTHSFSIYIWKSPQSATDKGTWIEPVQAYTQKYALYIANLIHQDSKSVIKIVDKGTTIACFPNDQTVEEVEKQLAS